MEDGLVFLGLVGLIDPPREEAVQAVSECRRAGIRVKMITGDHATTAAVIGAALGIGDGKRGVTGEEVDAADDEALSVIIRRHDVFARVSPEHKLRLVTAAQENGDVVAMTGDGVNDAPALKRSDIGVAMGMKGTEAAREAAGMVLADDNFATILHAVKEGRTVYDNIRKTLAFLLPTNGAQAAIIVIGVVAAIDLPVTPLQILWINMVTAVTLALALAFEPPEADIMRRPPRSPREPLMTPFLVWRVFYITVLMVMGTIGLYLWERRQGSPLETARTVAVNALICSQVFYLLSARYLRKSVLTGGGLTGNRYILAAVSAIILLQLAFTYLPPMQKIFDSAPLPAGEWLRIALVSACVFLLAEGEKRIMAMLEKRRTLLEALSR